MLHKVLGTKLKFSIIFYPQTNGHSERIIQVLEDMLRPCGIDFGGIWDQFLLLCEFSYHKNYHSSIYMTSFEALYGQKFSSPIG